MHDVVSEGTSWGSEGGIILVFGVNVDLVVTGETIHL